MKVILSANVSHYYYAARALHQAGYLMRYIASVTPTVKYQKLYGILPHYWRKKLEGRKMPNIDPKLIFSLWLPEVFSKLLERSRIVSEDRANWINNYLYDWMSLPLVERSDIFYFVSSIGLYAARKAKKLGAVVVCDERTEYPDFQRSILEQEYRMLGLTFNPPGLLYDKKIKSEYTLADYLVLPSSYAKQTFVDAGFSTERIFIIPYGFDTSQFQPLGKNDSIFRIVFCGQIVPRKGVHYLLQAFAELNLANAELLLIGKVDKTMAPIVGKYTTGHGNIKAVGNVPKVDLAGYYSSGSLFVLPSLSDSLGLVALEAMACGLPVITTDHTGAAEIVRDGIDGYVIPVRNVEALKEKIIRLYENRTLLKQMGEAGRVRVQDFTWTKYGERLIGVCREIQQREHIP